ncbi:sugar phosphate isomerase/epimerase family protein [Novipirellula artificiosorum]|uniref:Inosose dehydratase n=1 Tax=Novipirellula artificiosorum TaxID=2528016 RepID=A0A5C6E4Z2_9BACT|nr:TIM barrel protein [Novipirellula artificiosorum]TWU42496.1 Inosose dehydratase [Novipirellula artificiosorum]
MNLTRRESIAALGGSLLLASLPSRSLAANESQIHVATNTYPWLTFCRRDGQEFVLHTDQLLRDISLSKMNGYEPIINDVSEFVGLRERLQNHGLEMRSLYVNSALHEKDQADASIKAVLAIAKAASDLGTSIVVTNPSPIRWGGPEDKSDAQLRTQAESLDRLGAALRKQGQFLAYHNHDAELRQGAREFHHMLSGTNPENVKFCLDAHWVFRGCGDSEVAVFDALSQYADRIVELHLRQSVDGAWTEAFQLQGDIDYVALFEFLQHRNILPHLVLEQAIEDRSPKQLTVIEAHQQGREQLVKGWGAT